MKGKLIKTSRGWEVEYLEAVPNLHYLAEQNKALLLHPDDAVQIFGFGIEDRVGENVNFEIVDYGFAGKYAKIIKPKEGSFDEDGFSVTRGYKEPVESWDDIMIKYYYKNSNPDIPIFTWLSENYNAPTKK